MPSYPITGGCSLDSVPVSDLQLPREKLASKKSSGIMRKLKAAWKGIKRRTKKQQVCDDGTLIADDSTMQQQPRREEPILFRTSESSSFITTIQRRHTEKIPEQRNQQESVMQDEYGEMNSDGHTFVQPNFILESGQVLPEAQLRYQTYGTLNEKSRDNVLVVCHALTGNASLHAWWGDFLGPGKAFDTSKYFVVCCNLLGSCYGSTSPQSTNPTTSRPYGKDFPDISVRDTVRMQLLLLQDGLQIKSIAAVIGGSFGGMQTLEFAVQGGSRKYGSFFSPDASPFVKSIVPIACGVRHTAWQIAISEVQRQSIYADPAWNTDQPENATKGLAVARQMGMVFYRTAKAYQGKFGREVHEEQSSNSTCSKCKQTYGANVNWEAKSYLEYQGQKFLSRFDPVTYVKLTEQMDSHDLARGRAETADQVLDDVRLPALVMGIDSDVLYPLGEQQELARMLPNCQFRVITSPDGHDAFLLEQSQVSEQIVEFLKEQESRR